MQKDFTTRLAALFVAAILISNDLLASVHAMANYAVYTTPPVKHVYTPKNYPGEAERHETPLLENVYAPAHTTGKSHKKADELILTADHGTAFLGNHEKDATGNPSDDVFSFTLEADPGLYTHATLRYTVTGLADGAALPKTINGKTTYGEANFAPAAHTQRIVQALNLEDFKQGVNQVVFSVPQGLTQAVEINSVALSLTNGEAAVAKAPAMKLMIASPFFFSAKNVADEAAAIGTYALQDYHMAFVPRSIRNTTLGAAGYRTLVGGNSNPVYISMKVNKALLMGTDKLKEVGIYFFDLEHKKWQVVRPEHVDIAEMRVEATVPGNTDYFAGMITSPEMPEAAAYVPTAISDIEAANPAAGMNLMSPPDISHTGEASLSYPLAIPQGRQGMTPQLALSYNSDGGTGWLGVGWNINTPSVSIDTRWGVPQFSSQTETEVYLLNGQSLSMQDGKKANRAKVVGNVVQPNPRIGNAYFFEKTRSSYKEVERRGSGTKSYVWVETTANKTQYFYGTKDGYTLDPGSALQDDAGNVIRWYLTKVIDKWGNTINYSYAHTQLTNATASLKNMGKRILPDSIHYTGHGADRGKYAIAFHTSYNRYDATVSYKSGTKELDDAKLDSIRVLYDGDLVKSFKFQYGTGDFFKTILTSVSEYRSGQFFYSHTFDYYHGQIGFKDAQHMAVDHYGSNMLSQLPEELVQLAGPLGQALINSPLKTSSSFGWNTGGSIGLGVAPTKEALRPNLNFTFSGRAGYGETYTKDKIFFQDVSGDGLPDVVYDKLIKGRGFYALQRDDAGNFSLLPQQKIIYSGDLLDSRSTSFSYGFGINIPMLKLYSGMNWNEGVSSTATYLTDYNADGITDLIAPGANNKSVVHFGRLNEKGELYFDESSKHTYNTVIKGAPVNDDNQAGLTKDFEIVRTWEAPFEGTIQVDGLAAVADTLQGSMLLAIQKNSDYIYGPMPVSPGKTIYPTATVNVAKGDLVLFRAYSDADGQQDLLTWNPTVQYEQSFPEDPNGYSYGNSSYTNGFLLSGGEGAIFSGDESIKVTSNDNLTQTLTDDVVLNIRIEVLRNSDGSTVRTDSYEKTIPAGSTGTGIPFYKKNTTTQPAFMNPSFAKVGGADTSHTCMLTFDVFSTSNVRWEAIKWRPEVRFSDSCEQAERVVYPTVRYHTYNRLERLEQPVNLTELSDFELNDPLARARVLPVVSANAANYTKIFGSSAPNNLTQIAYLVTKHQGTWLTKLAMKFNSNGTYSVEEVSANGTLQGPLSDDYAFTAEEIAEPFIHVEIFAESTGLAEFIKDHVALEIENIDKGTTSPIEYFNLFAIDQNELQDKLLHWGHFAWSDSLAMRPIDTAHLHLPMRQLAEGNNAENISSPDELDKLLSDNQDVLNPLKQSFFMLQPKRGEYQTGLRSYIPDYDQTLGTGYGKIPSLDRYTVFNMYIASYAAGGAVVPGKMGEPEAIAPNGVLATPGLYGAFGISMKTESKTLANSSTYGSVSISATIPNKAKYFSESKSSLQDINGDGYPDVLRYGSNFNAQLTVPTGGHTSSKPIHPNSFANSTNESYGPVYNGRYINENKKAGDVVDISKIPPVSASLDLGFSYTQAEFMDINGDGLPDRLTENSSNQFVANLSTGTGLLSPIALSAPLKKGQSLSFSRSLSGSAMWEKVKKLKDGKQKYARSFSVGVSASRTGSSSQRLLRDLNGDGLVDWIKETGIVNNFEIYINTGTEFVLYHKTINANRDINESESLGLGGNVAGTFSFPLFPLGAYSVKMSISGNASANFSMNEVKSSLMDADGDGVVDYVYSPDNGSLEIAISTVGKSNKLKTVTNPLKGSFTIDYKLEGSKFGMYTTTVKTHVSDAREKMVWDMPNSKWVMSSLKVYDGLNVLKDNIDRDGTDTTKIYFAYDGGIHSRREREFLGFTRTEKRHLFNEGDFPMPQDGYTRYSHFNEIPLHFITEVTEYQRPNSNDPNHFRRFDYLKNVVSNQYVLYNKIVEVPDYSGEPNYFRYPRTIKPISIQQYEYDYRRVDMTTNYHRVAQVGQSWQPVQWATITETDCVFPAVVATTSFTFPQVEDARVDDKYYAMKYTIAYDEFFNVTQYANNGTQGAQVLDTVVVDTLYHTHYLHHTQNNMFSGIHQTYADSLSGDYYSTYIVPSNYQNQGYWPDTLVLPLNSVCGNLLYNDTDTIVTTHKKLVTDTVYVKALQDNSLYSGALIAQMQYFPRDSAAGQTNVLRRHKIYQYNTHDSNLTRHSYVRSLTAGAKVPGEIKQYLNATDYAAVNIAYDATYGNVTRITAPVNKHGQRLVSRFTYDNILDQFVIGMGNSYGDSACASYDFATGNLLRNVDINGHPTQYVYDAMYRVKEVWAPRELSNANSAATLHFAYYPTATVPVALTTHNMSRNEMPVNYFGTAISAAWQNVANRPAIAQGMRTATFVNGLGQAVQIKKDAAKDSATTILTSGLARVDHLGRQRTASENKLTPGQPILEFDSAPLTAKSDSLISYDYINRPLSVWNVASGIAGMSYTWEQLPGLGDVYREGGQHAVEVYTYKDSWGRTLRTKQVSRKQNGTIDEQLETDFFFNPLGELLRSENPLDVATHYTYDLFGRMVEEQHDDRGSTKLYYDMAGNVTAMQNPTTGTDSITMSYYYSRLTDKTMPQTDGLYGVQYTYGSLGDGKNGAGRVVQIQQGDNFKTDNLKYDELGNVVFENKIFALPSAIRTFTTRYDYDSWGRMQDVTYPDNEFVRYLYRSTGELEKIESKLNGQSHFEDIVRYADYDGYGNMNYLRYGNGAVTTFTYGANNQRLLGSIVNTRYSASNVNLRGNILNKEYGYDDFGRVEEVTNTPSVHSSLIGMGGSYTNAYTYDQFNRLSSTTASNTGFYTLDYTLTMAYNKAGGIKQKTMSSTSLPADKHYSFAYTYNNEATGAPDAKKHRLYRVENTGAGSSIPQRTQFDFNANGSIKNIKVAQTIGQPLALTEKYVHNEEQWLMGHEDVANGQVTHFVYDHTGNRILKGGLTNASLAINGQSGPLSLAMSPYTLYVNPYYVTQEFAANAVVSKHYYMGAQRVATQMAGTEDIEPAGDPGEGMMKQGEQTNSPILANLEHVLTDFGKQKGTDYQEEDLLRTAQLTDYYPDTTQPSTPNYKAPASGGQPYVTPRMVYYYHPDYLGNVEYITDADGLPYQYFWYSPWGENLKEENATANGWSSSYRFNGKEVDEETGLYYYGARYYNPQVSVWLGVDPKAADAPSWTPYRAFFCNPIRYTDPDGQWEKDSDGNLVAEKGDNAYTFAKYLNTDAKTAIKMLGEQGYNVNKKGILNLKVGDVFQVEYTTPAPESREDLGYMGNNVRDRAGSEFSKNMFENYWNGEGDVELSGKRFAGILMYVKENNPKVGDPSKVVLNNGDGTFSEGSKRVVSFYSSPEYDKVFGSATLYYNNQGNIVGFYDFYDFDSKPWGQRSTKNEVITRMVEAVSPSTAKPFSIRYGQSKR